MLTWRKFWDRPIVIRTLYAAALVWAIYIAYAVYRVGKHMVERSY